MRFFIAMLAGVLALMAGVVADQVWLMVLGGVLWVLAIGVWIAAPSRGPEPSGRGPNSETIPGEWIEGGPPRPVGRALPSVRLPASALVVAGAEAMARTMLTGAAVAMAETPRRAAT